MLKVGITGGIGSGKSTVCEIFKLLKIPVYNADREAKRLINTDPVLVKEISKSFGPEVYKNNRLDKAVLSAKVFNDKKALEQLNALVHPAVALDFEKWLSDKTTEFYIIKEAALLFESNSYKSLDKIITVTAPLDMRIERTLARDKSDRKAVEARIANQWSDEEKIGLSDYVINNNENHSLICQVTELHKKLVL